MEKDAQISILKEGQRVPAESEMIKHVAGKQS